MSGYEDLSDLLGHVASSPVTVVAGGDPLVVAAAGGSFNSVRGASYDGASYLDQLALWQPQLKSADAEILREKQTLDSRVRDMGRNDAFVAGGAEIHKDNIVGSTYLLNAKPMTKVLFGADDEVWESEFQEEVETKFTLCAESPSHWLDAQGTKTLTEQVRLAVGIHLSGGEVLSTAEWMPDDGRPFRTAIQMVDADRLSTPPLHYFDGTIRGGVERNTFGAPQAYWIRMVHPSDVQFTPMLWDQVNTWNRVPVRKDWGRPQVLHLYDQNRADQSRGISGMVAALSEMKMLKTFRRSELQRAVLAATYAASIESELPPADIFRTMGGDDKSNPVLTYIQQYLQAINAYSNGSKNLTIDGVRIPVFMPGTKLNLKNPGAESPAGGSFEQSALRYIAATLNVSYEQLSRDYTNTNYSSARASRGETEKHMMGRKKRVADAYANFAYGLWLEEAINTNQIEALKRKNVPNYYTGLNREAYTACDWIGAGAGLIDPLKETQAYLLQLNAKISSRELLIAKIHGQDWRRMLRQIRREETAYALAGVDITPADQNTQNALSGSPQTGASANVPSMEDILDAA